MFEYIYMFGGICPYIWKPSPAGGEVVRHPPSLGLPSSSFPPGVGLCLLMPLSYVVRFKWSMVVLAMGGGGFAILWGVYSEENSVLWGPRSVFHCP